MNFTFPKENLQQVTTITILVTFIKRTYDFQLVVKCAELHRHLDNIHLITNWKDSLLSYYMFLLNNGFLSSRIVISHTADVLQHNLQRFVTPLATRWSANKTDLHLEKNIVSEDLLQIWILIYVNKVNWIFNQHIWSFLFWNCSFSVKRCVQHFLLFVTNEADSNR